MFADPAAAAAWLEVFDRFLRVRRAFCKLAGLGRRRLPSLRPDDARAIWRRAMDKAGGCLSQEAARKLSTMSKGERLSMAVHASRALGLTVANKRRFARLVELEIETSALDVHPVIARMMM